MDNSEINYIKEVCKKEFGVLKKWTNTSIMSNEEALDNLRQILNRKFKILLEDDFNRLLNILYRTDISEEKMKDVFNKSIDSQEISISITNLYLNRLIEKWETRQMFKDDNHGDW